MKLVYIFPEEWEIRYMLLKECLNYNSDLLILAYDR
jgi:hypothetical protein